MARQKKKSRHESPLTEQMADAISSVSSGSERKEKSGNRKPMSKKAQKRAELEEFEKKEEERLTALLFGGGGANDDRLSSHSTDIDYGDEREESTLEISNEEDGDLAFEIDRSGHSPTDDADEDAKEELGQAWHDEDDEDETGDHSIAMHGDEEEENDTKEEIAPAWIDDDDAKIVLVDGSSRLKKLRRSRQEKEALSSQEFEQRLRQRYQQSTQSTARTDWATTSKKRRPEIIKSDDEDEDNDDAALSLFSTSRSLLASSRSQLPPNILGVIRCPDANLADPNKAVVRSINFHPESEPDQPLMLTAGLDKTLRFFQIGEEKSHKIHGIHCKFHVSASCSPNYQILCAAYTF